MNANTPEKIYIHVKNGKVFNTWNSEWIGVNDVEYTRTNTLIEKACKAYCKACKIPNCNSSECKLINEFKNYMKEE